MSVEECREGVVKRSVEMCREVKRSVEKSMEVQRSVGNGEYRNIPVERNLSEIRNEECMWNCIIYIKGGVYCL